MLKMYGIIQVFLKIVVRIILEVIRFDWYVYKGYINIIFVYNYED